MKYYSTGKKGFHKMWMKAGLKFWYLDLISVIMISMLIHVLRMDLSEYSVQVIVLLVLFMFYCSKIVTDKFFEKVLAFMEYHDYMTTDIRRKNIYKNLPFPDVQ